MSDFTNKCLICNKSFKTKNFINCNTCNSFSHYKCNGLSFIDYQITKNNTEWHCSLCSKELFPFSSLNDYKFNTINNVNMNYSVDKSRLILQPPPNLSTLYNEFNNLSTNLNNDSDIAADCKYYDIHEMKPFNDLTKNKASLSSFHLNISSLPKHIHDLEHLLVSMGINFDVIAITESRIIKNKPLIEKISLQNYSFDHCPTESTAGGTALFIKDNILFLSRPDLVMYKPFQLESNFVEIVNPKKTNIIIGCIYRHPNMDLSDFNENYLSSLLEKISKEKKSVILLGDFNIDLLKYGKHNATSDFLDTLSSDFFLPHIFLPTRVVGTSKTLIDNIFSNFISNNIISGNISASISDHLPQFSIFPDVFKNSPFLKSNICERNWSNFDQQRFLLDYFALNVHQNIFLYNNDVDKSLDLLNFHLNSLLDKHAPYKKISKYKLRLKSKPWLTNGIKKSIDCKNRLFTKYINAKDITIKTFFHEKYKIHRNLLSTLTKRSKKNYYSAYFEKNLKNMKNTWKGINSLISIKNDTSSTPSSIFSNNSHLSEPTSIANAFNSYFCNVAEEIQSTIKFSLRSFDYFLNDSFTNSFFISPTDSIEVFDIINELKSEKSHGPNGIPTKILHLLNAEISPLLADIFNLSFQSGKFPSILKIAKVIPIHKKSSKLDCSNYRPISILSNLDKILEKLIHKRLYHFLEINNIIYPLQFGFRKNFSTTHTLLSLTENIKQEIDKGKFGCGIFIDFQKAFDTVDHEILLSKLQYYGIRGKANDWFRSYLDNRQQFVSINGFNSSLSKIKCGVPQGSVLGPLLFLIYINDLYSSISTCKVHHFADDTNLLHFDYSVKKLNKVVNYDLKHLVHWLNANKISLNVGKTELVFFKPRKKQPDYNLSIKLNGKTLSITPSVKYLGVKIDSNLNWKEQQNSVAIKLNKANAILSKLRHYVNQKTLRSIYFSLFESHTNYANIVWGQNIDSSNRLFLLQKKAIRTMHFSQYLAHTDPLFCTANIVKIHDKVSIDNCMFISKSLCNYLPSLFKDWFIFSSSNHDHQLRSSNLGVLKIPKFRTLSHGRMSFRINAIYTWNNIQRVLKDHLLFALKPLKVKSILTKFYINQYY